MRRSKIVIGVFVGLILIVLTIVLLACTVFIIRDVSVESAVLSPLLNEDDIISSSGLNRGRSIISIDKDKISANIEKANPYVKVERIERTFPSKVIVKVNLRTGIMCVLSDDGIYAAVIDSSAKILKVISALEIESLAITEIKGITVKLSELSPTEAVGSIAAFSDEDSGKMLQAIAEAVEDPNLPLSGTTFRTLFQEIRFDRYEEGKIRAYLKTNTGVSLVLDSALSSSEFAQLFSCMMRFENFESREELTKGYIISYDDINWYWYESID